jgi:GTP pyrophosphokinase
MATIQEIINKVKKYNKKSDTKLIKKAYSYAAEYHKDQKRLSGEEYIVHPLEVADIITTLELDDAAICAALLHDTIEDTGTTYDDVKNAFGEEIAQLVEGVTKLGKLEYVDKEEEQAENYRKLFMAMAKDIRVLMVKLADRLHNMRTLKYLREERQISNAKETLQVYSPLANRLGIYSIKWELEDLAFQYIEPQAYMELIEGIKLKEKKEKNSLMILLLNYKKN